MNRIGIDALTACAIAALLCVAGCGDQASPAPADTTQATLRSLAMRADGAASKGEMLLRLEWFPKLRFASRCRARTDNLRAFVTQAGGATDAAGRADLIRRGEALFVPASTRLDDATTNVLTIVGASDRIHTYLGQLHPLLDDLGGNASPLHVRYDAWVSEIDLGMKHVDGALDKLVAGNADGETEFKIGAAALQRANETGARLTSEFSALSAEVHRADDRTKQFHARLQWAESIAAKVGEAKLTQSAVDALASARSLKAGSLTKETESVKTALLNALPDAGSAAMALAKKLDAEIRALTAAFLETGRSVGIPDPGQ